MDTKDANTHPTTLNTKTPETNASTPAVTALFWVFSLGNLLLHGLGGGTRVAGEIHQVVSAKPNVLAKANPEFHQAPGPYRFFHQLIGKIASFTPWHNLANKQDPMPLNRIRSWINGVLGDRLDEWQHPLATQMQTVDEAGTPLCLNKLYGEHTKGVAIFIHGLCLSENEWQSPAHDQFVADLREKGYGVAWLRYNTGLPVWENGRRMAEFFHQHVPNDEKEKSLMLFGHSMGGLLIRSASYHSRYHSEHQWHLQLSHAAYLATPHHGAPLERLGHAANSNLEISPYLKPLMALGNIRSSGIQSLRYGEISHPSQTPSDANITDSYLPDTNHLLLACSLSEIAKKTPIGDGLVPLDSAFAHATPFNDLIHKITKVHLDELGHIGMIQEKRLYNELNKWLLT